MFTNLNANLNALFDRVQHFKRDQSIKSDLQISTSGQSLMYINCSVLMYLLVHKIIETNVTENGLIYKYFLHTQLWEMHLGVFCKEIYVRNAKIICQLTVLGILNMALL